MKKRLVQISNIILKACGIMAIIFFILSLTSLPYHAYHWLGTSNSKLVKSPDTIILLGGSGMPSPDGFIRCYYAAEAALKYKTAEIIIALPFNEKDSSKQLMMMASDLMIRGVDSSRIKFESLGFNTHSQAENIAAIHSEKKTSKTLAIVTSPEHMYRAIRSFKKAGFKNVGGVPAFEMPIAEEKVKDKTKSDDQRVRNLNLRYNIWSYLNYEILVTKECFALAYYKIKGWI